MKIQHPSPKDFNTFYSLLIFTLKNKFKISSITSLFKRALVLLWFLKSQTKNNFTHTRVYITNTQRSSQIPEPGFTFLGPESVFRKGPDNKCTLQALRATPPLTAPKQRQPKTVLNEWAQLCSNKSSQTTKLEVNILFICHSYSGVFLHHPPQPFIKVKQS